MSEEVLGESQAECKDCGETFTISEKDKAFFAKLKYDLPKRCLKCRVKRREQKSQGGGRNEVSHRR